MSEYGRKALFYILTLAFLILGTGVVLFAQGWRMDLPSLRISKVGGIYVRSYPEDAAIFLNGKQVRNESGFLSRGTLISDLFPKNYHLALTAPGYDDWNETATVDPSFVVNHQYAVMVPATPADVATGTIVHFDATVNGIVSEATDGSISENGEPIGAGKILAVSPDAQSVVFQTVNGEVMFGDLPAGTVTNVSELFLDQEFSATSGTQIMFDPSTRGTLFAANAKKIIWLDLAQNTGVTLDAATKGISFAGTMAVSPDTAAWARSSTGNNVTSSLLVFYNLSSKTTASTTVALGSPAKELSWISGNLLGILSQNGAFFLYDTNQRTLQKMADDVRVVSATRDGSRIATLESHSMEIFTLNDPLGYYRFNLPDIADAQNATWYRDGDHLFISYPDHVALLDLEDAELTNFITVARGTSPEYDQNSNMLYLMNPEGHLTKFSFPK